MIATSPEQSRPVLPDLLCAAMLALALPLALASLYPIGYWEKAEPVQIWLHASAGLTALALLARLKAQPAALLADLANPFVLLPALLGLWSVAVAPLVAQPVLSLSGAPQSGYGALWFLDLAVFTACARAVRGHRRLWTPLLWWGIVVTALVAVCKAHDMLTQGHDLLIYVASYYGWIGLALAAAVLPDGFKGRIWLLAAAALAVIAVVIVAQSTTAKLLLTIAAIWLALDHFGRRWPPIRRLIRSRLASTALVGTAACLPYALLETIPGLGAIESLRDRSLLQKMMHTALSEGDVGHWLWGHGWGRTQDAFHTFLNVTGETLWQPNWIFLSSDYFHSHNWIIEALYAAGIPGFLLAAAGFLAVPYCAAEDDRPTATALATALAGLSCLWFPLAVSLPFIALAFAAFRPSLTLPAIPRAAAGMALAVLAAAQLGGAAMLLSYGLKVSAFQTQASSVFPQDPRGSDLPAAEAIRDSFIAMAKTGASPEAVQRARNMLAHLERHIPTSQSPMLIGTGINVLTQIHLSGELAWLAPHLPHSQALWGQWVRRVLSIAPGRSDLAISYLTNRAVASDLREVSALISAILQHDRSDAVGLYFQGLLLVLDPAAERKRQGIAALRASIDAGIERFMPLDPAIRALTGQ